VKKEEEAATKYLSSAVSASPSEDIPDRLRDGFPIEFEQVGQKADVRIIGGEHATTDRIDGKLLDPDLVCFGVVG
jgi:hypothetical protein